MRLEYMALRELERWPRNPKDHDLPELQRSMDRFGFTLPVMVDERSGRLVAGHGRLEALQVKKENGETPPTRVEEREDGEWYVPVIRGIEFNSPEEAEAYLLADNRHVEAGGWKLDELSQMLQELNGEGVSLAGLGWQDYELEPLLAAEWTPPLANSSLEDFQRDDGEGRGGGHTIKLTAEQWHQIRPMFEEAQERDPDISDGAILLSLLAVEA